MFKIKKLFLLISVSLIFLSFNANAIKIGLSQPNLGWPYIAVVTNTLIAEADKMDDVELIVMDAGGDIAKQVADLESLTAKGVDVIMFCSLDGNAIVPGLMVAHDAGIPLLAISNEPNEQGKKLYAGFSGPDDYVQGVIAAEIMHEALGGKGNVVVIEGSLGQSTTDLRNNGFKDGLSKLNSDIIILANQTANWDPVQAKAVTEDFITTFGDKIDGLFSQDDNTAASAAEVFKDAGMLPRVKIVGTGGSTNGLAAIKDGLVYGTMNQSPSTDAKQGLSFAIDLANGKSLPEVRNIIPMPIITAENVSQFKGEW